MHSLLIRHCPLPTLPRPTMVSQATWETRPVLPSKGDLCLSFISRSTSQMSVSNVPIPQRSCASMQLSGLFGLESLSEPCQIDLSSLLQFDLMP